MGTRLVFSDASVNHTNGIVVAEAAVGMGAYLFEAHRPVDAVS